MLLTKARSINIGSCHSHLALPRALCATRRSSAQQSTYRHRRVPCRASSSSETYYQGTYGPWKVEKEDVIEVYSYRFGLSVMALAFAAGTAAAVLPDSSLTETLRANSDTISILGAAGLGLSLVQIHIYVTELKRLIQAFWAAGTAGGLYLLLTQDQSVASYVAQHHSAVWLIGPLFASLTGVTFKEGLCYGKIEAFILTFMIPILLLGQLTGLVPETGEKVLAVGVAALLLVFGGRKYTQRVEDDIGDKSVFTFRQLSEEEQKARLMELQRGEEI